MDEGVELCATIAVVYVPERAQAERKVALASSRTAHNAFAVYEPPKEDWNASKGMPNRLYVWLDPFWEGTVVQALSGGEPVFRLRVTLRPLAFPRVAHNHTEAKSARTLCNQVKLHFFHEAPIDGDEGEVRRDFMYAAIVPLAAFFQATTQAAVRYCHAFSYIRCEVSANPIMGLRIALCATSARVPPHAALLPLHAPEVADHVRVMELTNWIERALTTRLFPKHKSVFCNMRTTFRNPHCSGLFQDIPAFFALPWTELPFSIGLYALLASLLVNGLRVLVGDKEDADHYYDCRVFSAADGVPPLLRLRVARDAMACFTLCHAEGRYWNDESFGVSTEDQPFPLSFLPSERVFPKDDCEGRASHVQMMKLLYQCMHRRLVQLKGQREALRAEVTALSSFRHLLGDIDERTVDVLLCEACALGGLLEAGALDLQTTVGDVHFGSLDEARRQEPVGHSFAVVRLRTPSAQREALVVETTGWQRRRIREVDGALSDVEQSILNTCGVQAVLGGLVRKRNTLRLTPSLCSFMEEAEEAGAYARLLLGHGCLYFMTRAGTYPYYGIDVPALRARSFVDRWEGPAPPTHGFSIDTRAFLEQLCTDAERASASSSPSATKAPRLWPAVPGARQALEWYDAIQARLAMHRRCLRPPPKTHAALEALIAERWQPITGAQMRAWTPRAGGLFFTVPQVLGVDEAQAQRAFACRWPGVRLQSLPFMQSRVYQLYDEDAAAVHQP